VKRSEARVDVPNRIRPKHPAGDPMKLKMHPAYGSLIEKANACHKKHRDPQAVTPEEIDLARLYCYAFRLHTIGTFHATGQALLARPASAPLSAAYRARATEALTDLANQGMDPVPMDFRAVISTLHRYHHGALRVIDSLQRAHQESHDPECMRIGQLFIRFIEAITTSCGIHLARDTEAPEQGSFVVPNLGIIIVPLVYGDHHSWNLAYLGGEARDVPLHRHLHGVEIHLGYNPTHGLTVLANARAPVDEGYAMPIPPQTDHGWVNTSEQIHHVPFIFGSLLHGGWGVFLDVEAQTRSVDDLSPVEREDPPFEHMVYLERRIVEAEAAESTMRTTLIPHTATGRPDSGGLELNLTRVGPAGFTFAPDDYSIVGVTRGRGIVSIGPAEREVGEHDHFGIPRGMHATIKPSGPEPLVVLDTLIRPVSPNRDAGP